MKYIVLLFIGLFFSSLVKAQLPLFWKINNYVVNINESDENIKAFIRSDKTHIKAKENSTYYWYTSNKIMETKGGFEGKLLYGKYYSFYLDNNLKEKGEFKNGLKKGKWTSWYPNGKIKEICSWKRGMKHGAFKSYNEMEELMTESNFKKGKLHGKSFGYLSGKMVSKRQYCKGNEVEWREEAMWKYNTKIIFQKIKKLFRRKKHNKVNSA